MFHLSHDLSALNFDRDLTRAEFVGNLVVEQSSTLSSIDSRSGGVSNQ
jgi:hypothetical protein